MIIWIAGQAGSGKTTVANALLDDWFFKKQSPGTWVQVDGDNIRSIFNNVDYSRAGRIKNHELAINLCKYLEGQGLNIMVSMIAPYEEIRAKIVKNLPEVKFIELRYDAAKHQRREAYKLCADYEEVPNPDRIVIDTGEVGVQSAIEIINSTL